MRIIIYGLLVLVLFRAMVAVIAALILAIPLLFILQHNRS